MAISKDKKTQQLKALTEKLENAAGVAFAQYNGLTVEEAQVVRRSLREKGMSYTVIKKTLMSLAAKNTSKGEFSANDIEGPVAIIISQTDEVAPAAAIKTLIKDHLDKETNESKYDYAGSIFEGKFLDKKETAVLAATPSREESLSKIVGMLRSGPQKLHGVFNSGLQKMHSVMDQADKFAKAS